MELTPLVLYGLGSVASGSDPSDPPSIPTINPTTAASSPRIPRRHSLDPWHWRFVGAHYGAGVFASLLVLPGVYGLARRVGHRGHGLGPVVGAMLIGALLPPALTYTVQWAAGRAVAPRRERYWSGWLVHQLGHLAVFGTASALGADFRVFAQAAPIVLVDAMVVTGLGSLTAELTRRPPPVDRTAWAGSNLPWSWPPPSNVMIVPIVKVNL